MYRYAKTTDKIKPILCTSPDCKNKKGAFTHNYITNFRIDLVSTANKEVTVSPDLYLTDVCTDCFLRIIQHEISRLGNKEGLH